MPRFPKKFFTILLLLFYSSTLLLSSFLSPSRTRAVATPTNFCDLMGILEGDPFNIPFTEGTWYTPGICEFSDKVFESPEDEIFGERYTYAQINWIINSVFLHSPMGMFFRDNFIDTLIKFFSPTSMEQSSANLAQNTSSGLLGDSFGFFYTHRPASGIAATRDLLAKFSISQPAHAQGYGYENITAVQLLWQVSRNASYVLMIVLLIAAAFMIMMRTKINPQTVVSLQLMIPKIIATLLLVTFSYALAGFIIDLVYVFLTFIISVIGSTGFLNTTEAINFFSGQSFAYIVIFYSILINTMTIITSFSGGIGSIFFMILGFILMFLLFKVWWTLLKAYLSLMFYIIAAPWVILLGLLPQSGGSVGIGAWLRNMAGQASVFVIVPLMFLMNLIILSTGFGGESNLLAFITTALSNVIPGFPTVEPQLVAGTVPSLPLFGNQGLLVYIGLSYAILALIPKAADLVRDALKMPAFKYGSAFGEALAPVGAVGSAAWRGTQPARQAAGAAVGSVVGPAVRNVAEQRFGIKLPGGTPPAAPQAN